MNLFGGLCWVFMWHMGSLLAPRGLSCLEHVGSQFPNQGLNSHPLR